MESPTITWIDMENWPRRSHFQSFTTFSKCLIHTSHRLDVTRFYQECKHTGHRFFPSMVCAVAAVANRLPEFRMVLSPDGKPGVWNYVSPSYSFFHEDDQTFSSICTEYDENPEALYQAIVRDLERYREARGHIASPILQNFLPTSCEPDLDFTSFFVQPCGESIFRQSIAPTIIWGRMAEAAGVRTIPFSVSINHIAADGYHVAKFFRMLQEHFDQKMAKS